MWRHVLKNLQPSARWKNIKIDSREIEFAWGPASGGVMTALGAIEIAIVAREGGAGTLWISDFEIEDRSPSAAATASASSALPGFDAGQALGGAGWMPRPDDAKPWITVDFTEARTLGGLIIDWRDGAPASGFRVRGSLRGRRWQTLYATRRAGGERSYVYLPDTKTRFLRLELNEPSTGAALRPQSFEFSRSIETFWYNVARCEPRGWHPRWLHREQSLWTPIGTSNGTHLRPHERGRHGRGGARIVLDRAHAVDRRIGSSPGPMSLLRQELLQGFLPVPSVIWETADWRLRVQAEATPSGLIRVRYRLENLSDQRIVGALAGARAPVSGDAALAERRQTRRSELHTRPGVAGGRATRQ